MHYWIALTTRDEHVVAACIMGDSGDHKLLFPVEILSHGRVGETLRVRSEWGGPGRLLPYEGEIRFPESGDDAFVATIWRDPGDGVLEPHIEFTIQRSR